METISRIYFLKTLYHRFFLKVVTFPFTTFMWKDQIKGIFSQKYKMHTTENHFSIKAEMHKSSSRGPSSGSPWPWVSPGSSVRHRRCSWSFLVSLESTVKLLWYFHSAFMKLTKLMTPESTCACRLQVLWCKSAYRWSSKGIQYGALAQ